MNLKALEDGLLERVARRVEIRMSQPLIPIEASGRHVHLCRADIDALFGEGHALARRAELSQPGQFLCQERIRVSGPKGEFASMAILGPERRESQVELSATDALALGIAAPVRLSGDIAGTPGARLAGPKGEASLARGVIVARRHIHMAPPDAERCGARDGQIASVYVCGGRPLTFHGVVLRVSPASASYMHIDYDEANACGFSKGMRGFLDGFSEVRGGARLEKGWS
jgi:propanediol utilization protein